MTRRTPNHTPLMVALDLRGRLVAVIGGGAVARRKLPKLLRAGARVRLIAPGPADLPSDVAALDPEGTRIDLLQRPYAEGDLAGCAVALACTDDPRVNDLVCAHARAADLWHDRVDAHEGDLAMTATSPKGAITLAASTGGASPALARLIRQHLDRGFGPEWSQAAQLADATRPLLREAVADPAERTRRLRAWVRSPLLDQLRACDLPGALQTTSAALGLSPTQIASARLQQPQASPGGQIVLSAFGPFPGVSVNPTGEVVRAVAQAMGGRAEVVELETRFDIAWEQLAARVEPLHAAGRLQAVVALGVSGRARCVQLERVGINVRSSARPDAAGRRLPRHGEPLHPGGPHGLMSRMPVEAMAERLRERGFAVEVSNSAGTYVCNEVLYKMLAWANRAGFTGAAGFVHVPGAAVMGGEEVAVTVTALVKELLGDP
ncbi:MAG: hypothetical protein CMH57_15145 [Myxococcales bacterium]|nr:hypothetical protein [Myxococcales bacterium]